MQPRKKSNTGLIIGIVLGALVLCCFLPVGLLVGGGFWAFNKLAKPLMECGATFTTARDSLRDYAREHDGKLPPAENWRSDIRTYYTRNMTPQPGNPFKPMSADQVWGCDNGHGGRTTIVFNSDLAGKKEAEIGRDDVVLFEVTNATASAAQKYEKQAFSDSPSMMNDHRGWFVAYWEGAPGFFDKRDVFHPFDTGAGRR